MDPQTGTANRNTFCVDDQEIFCIFDPSHLLKNWKNAWMKYDFQLSDEDVKAYKLPSNLIKFNDIIELAKFQVNILLILFSKTNLV